VRASAPALSALTFVSLHRDRERERGFNQAELIARELARPLRVPVLPGLARTRPTPAQVGLRQAERRENLIGAFQWVGAQRPPAGLGLVDDVCTTGATLEAAAEAIGEAGGSVAAYLVLARAQTLAIPAVTSPGQPACP
jgi:predicted amidophosphoribosyltransferase